MSTSEFIGIAVIIVILIVANRISESVKKNKAERKKNAELARQPVYTRRQFSVPAPSGECKNGHQFAEAYSGYCIHVTPYVPMHLKPCPVNRCRICGCREKPPLGPEDLPAGQEVPKELNDRIFRFAKIRDMSQEDLARLIRDPDEDLDYRMYAAETITDQTLILQLLRKSHMKNPKEDDTAVWTRLVWQLPSAPDGGPFESIAADPAYPKGARELAITRILDMDVLERLAADPDLIEACGRQRPEAMCREGHDWKVISTNIKAHDSYRTNSPYWVVDTYRCTRCGKTRYGEMRRTMTSPYANDD